MPKSFLRRELVSSWVFVSGVCRAASSGVGPFLFEDSEYFGCSHFGNGGALYVSVRQATVFVTRCQFRECSASYGGGIYVNVSVASIAECQFVEGTALNYADSIYEPIDSETASNLTEIAVMAGFSVYYSWRLSGKSLSLDSGNLTHHITSNHGGAGRYSVGELNVSFSEFHSNQGSGGF
jgi:hypothetical protein